MLCPGAILAAAIDAASPLAAVQHGPILPQLSKAVAQSVWPRVRAHVLLLPPLWLQINPAAAAACHCSSTRLLPAACRLPLQLNMRNLKERERWAAGWLQKSEIQAEQELAGAECKACGGTGSVPCPLCSSRGLVVEL